MKVKMTEKEFEIACLLFDYVSEEIKILPPQNENSIVRNPFSPFNSFLEEIVKKDNKVTLNQGMPLSITNDGFVVGNPSILPKMVKCGCGKEGFVTSAYPPNLYQCVCYDRNCNNHSLAKKTKEETINNWNKTNRIESYII